MNRIPWLINGVLGVALVASGTWRLGEGMAEQALDLTNNAAEQSEAPHPSSIAAPWMDPRVALEAESRRLREQWPPVERQIDTARAHSRDAISNCAGPLRDFFETRRQNARALAMALLSWTSKWKLFWGYLPLTEADEHRRYMEEQITTHLFSETELEQQVHAMTMDCTYRLTAIENRLLTDIGPDLLLTDPAAPQPRLTGDPAFAVAAGSGGLQLRGLGTEGLSLFLGLKIGNLAMERILPAVATRLGLSSAALGTGASFSWTSFGSSLLICVLVDQAISEALSLAGMDPEDRLTELLEQAVDETQHLLLDGNTAENTRIRDMFDGCRRDGAGLLTTACARATTALPEDEDWPGIPAALAQYTTTRIDGIRIELRTLLLVQIPLRTPEEDRELADLRSRGGSLTTR
ncbi:MAG: hypothetical protein ABIK09_19730 [Pseudomonadota bacterium]